ncbi:MAG: DDE-type integrase/transposase/recombinase [Nitrososphaerales archaeon]
MVQRLKDALPKPERRYRRCIAVDETKTKLGKKEVFIWAARDVDGREALTFRCSFTRSSLDAELFLKGVLQFCENKPLILVDRAPWYKDALKRLELMYEHQTFGERNRIERWFRHPQGEAQNLLQPLPSQHNPHINSQIP